MIISEQQRNDPPAFDDHNQSNQAISRSARVLLRRVFSILRGCGISENKLRQMAVAAVDEVTCIPDSQPSRVTARQAIMCCDLVLKWRRDCKFVDEQGMPSLLALDNSDRSFG